MPLFRPQPFQQGSSFAKAAAAFARLTSLACLGFLALVSGCSKPADSTPVPPEKNSTASTNRQVYSVKGVLKGIEKNGKSARVAHEEVPGYMPAMTMSFDLKNTNELTGLKNGDPISFDMVVTPDDGWIENVMRLDPTNQVHVAKARETVRRVRDVDPLAEGDKLPNYPFTNQLGQAVSLESFKGGALGLTFIFTRCPFPNFCPRMSANFESVVAKLEARGPALTNWHMVSITIDPDFDTPEVLKAYAARYIAPEGRWSFLTGAMIELDAITEQFGLSTAVQDGLLNHNLRTVVIDAGGRVRKIYVGNEWKVDEMVEEMTAAANPVNSEKRQ